jgi:HEAT repeat protein
MKGILLCLVLILPLHLFADEEKETIAQTASQALMDLRSNSPEQRRGSIMLLAKYPQHPSALPAIAEALDDKEPAVRRAAAVSLGENIRTLDPLLSSRLAAAVTDPDPEVRLTSSAWLPQLVLKSSTFPTLRPGGSSPPPDPRIREFLTRGVTAGLEDPEPLIRVKALESLQYLRWPVPQALLIPLMGDPDQRVRLQAYQTLYSKLPQPVYIAEASRLHPDESQAVRLVLAETLSRQSVPAAIPLLRKLVQDPVSAIQLQASVGLCGADPASGLPEGLRIALMEGNLEPAIVFQVFNIMNRLPEETRKSIVQTLLESESVSVRSQAVLRWLQWNPEGLPSEAVQAFLEDPASEVRQIAIRHFTRRPALLEEALVLNLVNNPYEDVRRQAIALSAGLSAEGQGALALRLLMDTVPAIRAQAIGLIIQLRPPNWPRLLKASLRDPAPEVNRAAAQALLDQMGTEGQQVAADFARDYPDADISSLIRTRLGLN